MRKITVKVITISSQILVAMLFLLSLFVGKGNNDKVTVVYNNNFDKMADRTLFLFEKEEFMTSSINESVVVVLEDNTQKEIDEVIQEDTIINIYTLNDRPLKYMKQELTELREKQTLLK